MKAFIPALRFHFLTPIYDSCARLLFGRTLRNIVKILAPQPGEKILDLGCGPGNLLVEIGRRQPEAELTGVDIDPAILRIAQRKLARAKISARLIEGSAAIVPLQRTFDAIVSTLVIHHIEGEDRRRMLSEAHRLLKPGGRFLLYDFGPPKNAIFWLFARLFRHFEDIDDGISGRYPQLLRQAGFRDVRSVFRSGLFELIAARH